jgi:hypothetical protein
MAAPLLASHGRTLAAYTSVPCLPPDGANERQLGNEWELAHATAVMAGINVRLVPVDADGYGVIQEAKQTKRVSGAVPDPYWAFRVSK